MCCFVRDHDWPHSVTIKCPRNVSRCWCPPSYSSAEHSVLMSCHRGKESKHKVTVDVVPSKRKWAWLNFLHWLSCNPPLQLLSWNNKQLNMCHEFVQACIAGSCFQINYICPSDLVHTASAEGWAVSDMSETVRVGVGCSERPETMEWRSSDGEGGNGTKLKDKRL